MYGVDLVSGAEADWAQVRLSGRTFAYVEATTGICAVTEFARPWQAMFAAGILRGAAHALRNDESTTEQAVQFLKVVELRRGDLPPVLDISHLGDGTGCFAGDAIRAWLGIVESEFEARHGSAPRTTIRTARAWRAQIDHRASTNMQYG